MRRNRMVIAEPTFFSGFGQGGLVIAFSVEVSKGMLVFTGYRSFVCHALGFVMVKQSRRTVAKGIYQQQQQGFK